MFKEKSDCGIILDNAENMFNDLGNCFKTAIDENKTKMNVVGSIFSLGKSLTKLTFNVGVCAVKKTPKAISMLSDAKKELIETAEVGIYKYQRKIKQDALDEKIKELSFTSGAFFEKPN